MSTYLCEDAYTHWKWSSYGLTFAVIILWIIWVISHLNSANFLSRAITNNRTFLQRFTRFRFACYITVESFFCWRRRPRWSRLYFKIHPKISSSLLLRKSRIFRWGARMLQRLSEFSWTRWYFFWNLSIRKMLFHILCIQEEATSMIRTPFALLKCEDSGGRSAEAVIERFPAMEKRLISWVWILFCLFQWVWEVVSLRYGEVLWLSFRGRKKKLWRLTLQTVNALTSGVIYYRLNKVNAWMISQFKAKILKIYVHSSRINAENRFSERNAII